MYGQIYALDTQSTLKIYHQIFQALTDKEKINVYTVDKDLQEVFEKSKIIVLVNQIEKSDIVVFSNESVYLKIKNKLLSNKSILFTTNYPLLRKSDDIVGAFYWKKGRAQLLFVKKHLVKNGIKLPVKYSPYIVDEL